ncbi:histone lysine methyltransferase Set3 [Schizosaccharomyces cryophilus OY26]|uniref:Histone lysine methyltransferase Set3 n=1 Tax=Schizosaccharomyces cryophilus (strain OY26 / ATCC MYA-4695 / CBS 11777 / NBRC 106824 / NRRL Y48691) TaxID=653667 RepID=S9VY87_SCHCR|nr:histone lysine methyltransferase Set3 [Schizosaccharomyces cryophilus OY26]EPY52613.1 histone lysine methyltransferase Set3 [Schizosaccharomyces cryophilus OY26]
MWRIRCVCPFDDDDGFTIQCENCEVWQHAICFEISSENVPENYLCEQCHPRPVDTEKAHQLQLERIQQETHVKAASRRRPHSAKARSHSGSRHASSSVSSPHQVPHSTSSPSNGFVSAPPPPNIHVDATNVPNTNNRRKRLSHLSPSLPEVQNPSVVYSSSIPYSPHLEYVPLTSNTYSAEALKYAKSLSGSDMPNAIGQNTDDSCYVASVQPKSFCSSRFGLFTSRYLVPDYPITEIKGRIFTQHEYKRDPKNQYCLIGVPKPHVYFDKKSDLVIDARVAGSKARFIRRSCQPNCTVISCLNEADSFTPTFYLMPIKPIESESELTVDWTFDAAHPFQYFSNNEPIPSFTKEERERLLFILSSITSNADCAFADKRNCSPQRYASNAKPRLPISNTTSFSTLSHGNFSSSPLEEATEENKKQSVKSLKQSWLAKYQSLGTISPSLKETVEPKIDNDVLISGANSKTVENGEFNSNIKMEVEDSTASDPHIAKIEVVESKAISPTPPSPSMSHTPQTLDLSPKSSQSRKGLEEYEHSDGDIPNAADIAPLTPPHGFKIYDSFNASVSPERRKSLGEAVLLSNKEDKVDVDNNINNNRRKMASAEPSPQTKRRRSSIHIRSPPKADHSRNSIGTDGMSLLSLSPIGENTHIGSDSLASEDGLIRPRTMKQSESSFFSGLRDTKEKLVANGTSESTKVVANSSPKYTHSGLNNHSNIRSEKSMTTKGILPHNHLETAPSELLDKGEVPSFSESLLRRHDNYETVHSVTLEQNTKGQGQSEVRRSDGQEKIPGPPTSTPPAPPPGPAPSSGPKKLSLSEYRQRRQEALKSKQLDSNGRINNAERQVPSAPNLNTAAST